MEDIFVVVMCALALVVGIWTWWYENYGPVQEDTKTGFDVARTESTDNEKNIENTDVEER